MTSFGVKPRARALHEGLIVVAEGDGRRIGLFVDELLGQQQVVIKSMETNYGAIAGVAGATILGDGSVALILDLTGLIRVAAQAGGSLTCSRRARQSITRIHIHDNPCNSGPGCAGLTQY